MAREYLGIDKEKTAARRRWQTSRVRFLLRKFPSKMQLMLHQLQLKSRK